jgi:uncharacterized RDD family membrane protein YckC
MTANWISPVPQEARAYQGERAGAVTRLVASIIDAVVVVVMVFAAYVGYASVSYLLHPRHFSLPAPSGVARSTFVLALLIVYLAVGWGTGGRTYGCHVMGLRVVNSHGNRLNPLVALARAVFCALFPIGLFWCAVSRKRRSVQDLVLRSSVIYDWNPRAPWR